MSVCTRFFSDAGDEVARNSTGEITDTRFERALNKFDRPSISGSYSHVTPSGNAVNLVAELNGNYSDRGETSERLAGGPDEPGSERTIDETSHTRGTFSLFETDFGNGKTTKKKWGYPTFI